MLTVDGEKEIRELHAHRSKRNNLCVSVWYISFKSMELPKSEGSLVRTANVYRRLYRVLVSPSYLCDQS